MREPAMKTRLLAFVLGIGLMARPAHADVRPHALCADGMVLQQKAHVNVWGSADKGETVSVIFRGMTAKSQADEAGNWSVALDAGAAGGPFEMTIKGNNTITY